MPEHSITVGIVSFNTREATLACLRSLDRVKDEGVGQLVVVDNNSHDGTAESIHRSFPDVEVISNQENRGFAAGANQILGAAQSDLVLTLNPDTWVTPRAIRSLVQRMNSSEQVAVVGAQIATFKGDDQPSFFEMPTIGKEILNCLPELKSLLFFRSLKNRVARKRVRETATGREVTSVSGAAMLLRRMAVLEAGGFDERFFLYHEELDLCVRLKKLGYVNLYEPKAVILHHEALASGYRIDRLPSDPVLSWRLQGKDLLFSKHFQPRELRRYRRIASQILLCRSRMLALWAFVTGRRAELSERTTELKRAARCVRVGVWTPK